MAKIKEKTKAAKPVSNSKRIYVSQSDIPMHSLEESISVAQSIYDNYGGRGTPPHQVAIALELSPAGKVWQNIAGASIAYGLTNGGCKSTEINVTDLGKKIVAPEEDGEDLLAKVDACLTPKIIKDFFAKYDKAKFPKDIIGKNVLISMGVPKEKVEEVYQLILANGKYVGIIQETKTGPFVFIGNPIAPNAEANVNGTIQNREEKNDELPFVPKVEPKIDLNTNKNLQTGFNIRPRVFISHGKNKKIVEQLK